MSGDSIFLSGSYFPFSRIRYRIRTAAESPVNQFTSLIFPVQILRNGYRMMPMEIPPMMLLLNGIPAKIRNAGTPSVQSSQLIPETDCIIMTPTAASAPEVTGGDERGKEHGQQKTESDHHGCESGFAACFDSRGAFQIGGHRALSAERACNGRGGVGGEDPFHPFDLIVPIEKFCACRHADDGSHCIEHVHEETDEDQREQFKNMAEHRGDIRFEDDRHGVCRKSHDAGK